MSIDTIHVAILTLELHIPSSQSLKSKRRVLRSLKDRIRNKFNVSIAEVGFHDKWQRATVGICAIGNDKNYLSGSLEHVLQAAETVSELQITHYEMEFV